MSTEAERRIEVSAEGGDRQGRRGWSEIMDDAERRGVDMSRSFRVLQHITLGYVEFFQVPA